MFFQEIAIPIELCIHRLIEIGMAEEGLFRVAGSATKIRRLKGAFDANLVTDKTLSAASDYDRDYDVHVVAGALKCYLRELPEPLLTHVLHDQWLDAVRQQEHQSRLRAMWRVVNNLPPHNLANLRYVVKFLAMLCSYSSHNKMTVNNIAIVIGPNLIWSQRELEEPDQIMDISMMGRNITLGNDYRLIIEHLIEYSDYFFKEPLDFGVYPKTPLSKIAPNGIPPNQSTLQRPTHKRNQSTDNNAHPYTCDSPKQPQRRKKQAPKPPQVTGSGGSVNTSVEEEIIGHDRTSSSSSPEQSRSHTQDMKNEGELGHTRDYSGDMSSSTEALSSAPSTPAPAPRLHHTSSIRRPTIEPPKPPTTDPHKTTNIVTADPHNKSQPVQPIKPPRPSPPLVQQSGGVQPLQENKTEKTNPQPLGFEQLGDKKEVSTEEDEVLLRHKPQGSSSKDATIGFNVDVENSSKTTQQSVTSSSGSNANFRKSLENVLLQQAAGQPVVLPRHQQGSGGESHVSTGHPSASNIMSSSTISSSSDINSEPSHDASIMSRSMTAGIPVFPVPAQRTISSMGGNHDKPEPVVSIVCVCLILRNCVN